MSPDSQIMEAEFIPTTQSELSRFITENAVEGRRAALYPVGGRTSLHYGFPASVPGTIVSMASLNRVIDYPARDMTVTVEAGIRMHELESLLKGEGQQLPIDVPQSQRATLGGAVATNTGGPRRFGFGTFRDYVIGLTAVAADGRMFHSGGRVVKNVAGYDMCKLLVGSLGTLAIITQLTLKLRPIPESSVQVWLTFDSFAAIDRVLDRLLVSETRPIALDVLDPRAAAAIATEARSAVSVERPVLIVGFEGSRRETHWQVDALRKEFAADCSGNFSLIEGDETGRLWTALTEFQCSADDPLTFQAHLLPSKTMEFCERATRLGVAIQAHAGNGLVMGQLPDEAADIVKAREIVALLMRFARASRGNLTVLNCERGWKQELPIFGEPEAAAPVMKRIKAALDPQDLLNPGRMFGTNIED